MAATVYPCLVVPEFSGYAEKDGTTTISTQLEGGAPKYRADVGNASANVDVTWIVNGFSYQYLRAFYNTGTSSGSLPFTIQLYLDKSTLTNHLAYFVPGTFSVSSIEAGPWFTVSASLNVTPINPVSAADVIILNSYTP